MSSDSNLTSIPAGLSSALQSIQQQLTQLGTAFTAQVEKINTLDQRVAGLSRQLNTLRGEAESLSQTHQATVVKPIPNSASFEELLSNGRGFCGEKNYAEAIKCFTDVINALQHIPQFNLSATQAIELATAFYELGWNYEIQGNLATAAEYYTKAIKTAPEDWIFFASIHFSLGWVSARVGDWENAKQYSNLAVKFNLSHTGRLERTHGSRGNEYECQEKWALKFKAYTDQIELKHSDHKRLAEAQINLAKTFLSQESSLHDAYRATERAINMPSADNNILASAFIIQGAIRQCEGNWVKAAKACTSAIDLNPDDQSLLARAHLDLGWVYFNQDKWAEAIDEECLAVAMRPELHQFGAQLPDGKEHLKNASMSNDEEHKRYLQLSKLSQYQQLGGAFLQKGVVSARQEKWDLAKSMYLRVREVEKAVKLSWSSHGVLGLIPLKARLKLGEVLVTLKEWDQAIAEYDYIFKQFEQLTLPRSISSSPQAEKLLSMSYLNRGVAREMQGDRASAIGDYKRVDFALVKADVYPLDKPSLDSKIEKAKLALSGDLAAASAARSLFQLPVGGVSKGRKSVTEVDEKVEKDNTQIVTPEALHHLCKALRGNSVSSKNCTSLTRGVLEYLKFGTWPTVVANETDSSLWII